MNKIAELEKGMQCPYYITRNMTLNYWKVNLVDVSIAPKCDGKLDHLH